MTTDTPNGHDRTHSLLRRQLKKTFGDAGAVPDALRPFLDVVDEAYHEFDDDREMLERSLDLSSQELLRANADMRAVFQAIPDHFFRLDADGVILEYKGGETTGLLLPADQVIGKRIQSIPVAEVARKFNEAVRNVREGGSMEIIEYALTLGGAEEFFEARLLPLAEKQIIAIVRNISQRKRAEIALLKVHAELERRVQERTAELETTNAALHSEIAERKRAEQELRLSEEQFRQLAQGINQVFWLTSVDPTTTLYVSPAYEKIWGRPCSELSGDPQAWLNAVHPDDRERVRSAMRAKQISGEYDEVYRILRPDGAVRYISDRAFPIRDEHGQVYRIAGVAEDITERQAAHQRIEEAERRYRVLVEQLPAITYIVNVSKPELSADDNVTVYISPQVQTLLGYTPAEWLQNRRLWIERIHAADRDAVLARVEHANRARDGFTLEYRLMARDGRTVWVSNQATYLKAEDGGTICQGVMLDITGLKMAEDRLRTAHDDMERTVAERTAELRALNETLRREIEVRQQAERALEDRLRLGNLISRLSTRFIKIAAEQTDDGITESLAEIGRFLGVDRDYVFLFSPDHGTMDNTHEWCDAGIPSQRERLQGIRCSAFPWSVQHVLRREIVHVPLVSELPPEALPERTVYEREHIQSLLCVPLLSSGSVIGLFGFDSIREARTWPSDIIQMLQLLGDIIAHSLARKRAETALRQKEEQVRQVQKMEAVGRLAGGIAHDFNNLLTSVLGYCDLIRDQLPAQDPIRADLDEIINGAERASGLTRQLLAFGRKHLAEACVFNVNEVVHNLERLLHRTLGEDIDLQIDLAAELGNIRGDPGHLEQVLLNLAINARDAMPAGGRLTVATRNIGPGDDPAHRPIGLGSGPCILLRVADTGMGMTEEVRQRAFEPFFTTKESRKGSGLGLAMVYGIVQLFKGSIMLDSEPGKGTEFRIYLPRTDQPVTPVRRPAEGGEFGGSETILVVEDEPAVRQLSVRILRSFGYNVLPAANGAEALEIAAQHRDSIRLLFTDLVMPRMGGYELSQKFRRICPDAAVLFTSGFSPTGVLENGIAGHVSPFIAKPYTRDSLGKRVREVLRAAPAPARSRATSAS